MQTDADGRKLHRHRGSNSSLDLWFGFCRIYHVQQKTAKDQNYLISAKPVKKQKLGKNFLSTPFAESTYFVLQKTKLFDFC